MGLPVRPVLRRAISHDQKKEGIRKLPALDVPSCKDEGLADHEVTNGPWDWSPGLCNLRYFRAGACPKLPGARRGPQRAENQPKTRGRAHKGTRKRIAPKPRLRASGGSAHTACVQARFRRDVLACAFACALVCLTPCVPISGPLRPTAGPVRLGDWGGRGSLLQRSRIHSQPRENQRENQRENHGRTSGRTSGRTVGGNSGGN